MERCLLGIFGNSAVAECLTDFESNLVIYCDKQPVFKNQATLAVSFSQIYVEFQRPTDVFKGQVSVVE